MAPIASTYSDKLINLLVTQILVQAPCLWTNSKKYQAILEYIYEVNIASLPQLPHQIQDNVLKILYGGSYLLKNYCSWSPANLQNEHQTAVNWDKIRTNYLILSGKSSGMC